MPWKNYGPEASATIERRLRRTLVRFVILISQKFFANGLFCIIMKIEDTPLLAFLRRQNILLGFLKEKIRIVQFLRWGYETKQVILYENSFLHFTSHMCLRNAILDLCALFDNHRHQGFNFYRLLDTKKKLANELDENSKQIIQTKLDQSLKYFAPIKLARDNEIAHYRFENDYLQLSHHLLPNIVSLYLIAEDIHDEALWNEKDQKWMLRQPSTYYNDGTGADHLKSLQRLLKKITKIDFEKLWAAYEIEQIKAGKENFVGRSWL